MIEAGHGNLLTADVEAIVNTVNTVGVMGKGIALQFKRAYPENYGRYRAACQAGQVQLGAMFVHDHGQLGPRRYIINFPTKAHWKSASTLDDIQAGLGDLVRVVRELQIESVAVPALGCGNGGLDWADVRPLIEEAAGRMPGVRVVVYAPDGAPDPRNMPVATPRPELNGRYAALLEAVRRYLASAMSLEPRDGISEVEIQKLTYFLLVLGLPMQLSFSRGPYGPYAESLHPILQDLEGHYLIGYGDRSAKVGELHEIELTSGAAEAARAYLAGDTLTTAAIDTLLALVDGFETPYSMELLATVHYASGYPSPTTDTAELTRRVHSWNQRKARLFTPHHVIVAAERLSDFGLLDRPIPVG